MSSAPTSDWISITENPLSPDELSNWVIRPNCGAVVTFSGIVRDHSSTRENVIALEYETNSELAEQRLRDVVDEAGRRSSASPSTTELAESNSRCRRWWSRYRHRTATRLSRLLSSASTR